MSIGAFTFRFKQVITIDGEDARDFDDAISIEKSGNDYILGVHIADVSHYIAERTPLYAKYATLTLDTSNKGSKKVLADVYKLLKLN